MVGLISGLAKCRGSIVDLVAVSSMLVKLGSDEVVFVHFVVKDLRVLWMAYLVAVIKVSNSTSITLFVIMSLPPVSLSSIRRIWTSSMAASSFR